MYNLTLNIKKYLFTSWKKNILKNKYRIEFESIHVFNDILLMKNFKMRTFDKIRIQIIIIACKFFVFQLRCQLEDQCNSK